MASSIAEALAGRTLVLTSLPDPKAVTAAWLGADGIVAHAAKGTLCIELSTIDPQTMRQVAEAAARAAWQWSIARSAAAPPRRAAAS